ncbi:MAG TPA: hypothetical protein PKI15_10715 [Candidatus Cloacimonadota bacterium]|nr:hypothetical protein [Candidatus Cloacimonadota bacterium]
MTRPNARKPRGGKLPTASQPSPCPPTVADELVLHGDVSTLKDAFVSRPRCLVTCPVPDSIYQKLQKHPGGISAFYEEAVAAFDGDLVALVNAAVAFVEVRRSRAGLDPPRNASGRIMPSTFTKIRKIEDALSDIRGMSRAKVMAGLINLQLG